MTVAFRPAEPQDQRFIVDSWVSSFRTSYSAGLIQIRDFHAVMWPQIERALARPDVRTIVAHETQETDHVADLYGFITADTSLSVPLVYYVFVKAPARRARIAARLFAAIGVDPAKPFAYACKTAIVSQLARKIPMAKWQPLLARYPKTEQPRRTR